MIRLTDDHMDFWNVRHFIQLFEQFHGGISLSRKTCYKLQLSGFNVTDVVFNRLWLNCSHDWACAATRLSPQSVFFWASFFVQLLVENLQHFQKDADVAAVFLFRQPSIHWWGATHHLSPWQWKKNVEVRREVSWVFYYRQKSAFVEQIGQTLNVTVDCFARYPTLGLHDSCQNVTLNFSPWELRLRFSHTILNFSTKNLLHTCK